LLAIQELQHLQIRLALDLARYIYITQGPTTVLTVPSTFTRLNAELQTPARLVQQKNHKVKKTPTTEPSQKRQNKTKAKKANHLKF